MAKRLLYVDLARTLAVVLALCAHSFYSTGLMAKLGSGSLYLTQFVHLATPMFIFMFGFMIEYVYVRQVKEGRGAETVKRLLARSLQCYLCYALTALAGVLGGWYSFGQLFDALLFLEHARFGNILRIYTLLMLLAPFLILLRLRWGAGVPWLLLILVLGSFPLLSHWHAHVWGLHPQLANLLVGTGPVLSGPSTWHAASFALAGMCIASCSTPERANEPRAFVLAGLGLLCVAAAMTALFAQQSLLAVWQDFSSAQYRHLNALNYYTIGIATSTLLLLATRGLQYAFDLAPKVSGLLPLGRASLLAYTAGNVFLNLFTPYELSLPGSIAFIVVFFVSVLAVATWTQKLPYYEHIRYVLNLGVVSRRRTVTPAG
ncbi:OpgC domain-containing protein [Salinisphaera sp. SPP-AMP-43]|uniref:OpgC domain-containing protein n=1 Tax=Salinisphaera sp. SPP-AMP-43 TaxID=3121288 RepID=UPI003C6E37EE